MQAFSDKNIIKGIRKRNGVVVRYLYRTCYPDIRKLVLNNKGTHQDAQDLFQEALLLVYQKIHNLNFTLTCTFRTYLYSFCRLMWLKELENRKNKGEDFEYEDTYATDIREDTEIFESIKMRIYKRHFGELSQECQDVLNMYFDNVPMEDICTRMGYLNIQVAREKKYRCKKNLMTRIYNNPAYKKLQDEIYMVS
jgi:RNA polymerase sigma factor (sigma-70 family)